MSYYLSGIYIFENFNVEIRLSHCLIVDQWCIMLLISVDISSVWHQWEEACMAVEVYEGRVDEIRYGNRKKLWFGRIMKNVKDKWWRVLIFQEEILQFCVHVHHISDLIGFEVLLTLRYGWKSRWISEIECILMMIDVIRSTEVSEIVVSVAESGEMRNC